MEVVKESDIPGAYYILNADNKLELHLPDKSTYMQLPDEMKKSIKSGFVWGRRRGAWVSRSKGGHIPWQMKNYYIPYQGAKELISFEDAEQRRIDRLENKADRYETYAANAAKRGKALRGEFDEMRKDWSWLTQPNVNTSRGRAFTRQREKVYQRYDKGMRESIKADEMNEYSSELRSRANNDQLGDRGYLENRLAENKKIIDTFPEFEKRYNKAIAEGVTDSTLIWFDGRKNVYKNAFDKYGYFKHHYDKLIEEQKKQGIYFDTEAAKKSIRKDFKKFMKDKHGLKVTTFRIAYKVKNKTVYIIRTDGDLPEYLQSGYANNRMTQLSLRFLHRLVNKAEGTAAISGIHPRHNIFNIII